MTIIEIFSKIISNPHHLKPYRDLIGLYKDENSIEKQAFEELVRVKNETNGTNSNSQ